MAIFSQITNKECVDERYPTQATLQRKFDLYNIAGPSKLSRANLLIKVGLSINSQR